jgi:diguanylate cyclase (GGDEF)-like protein
MVEDRTAAANDQLRVLREIFRQRLDTDIPELERLAAILFGRVEPHPPDPTDAGNTTLKELNQALHKLAGSAGTFKCPELGAAARDLEVRIQKWLEGEHPDPSEARAVHAGVQALRGLVPTRQAVAKTTSDAAPKPAMTQTSDSLPASAASERQEESVVVCLVEDDLELADNLKRAFEHFGYRVDHYERLHDAAEAVLRRPPDVLILDVTFHADGMNTIEQVALSPVYHDLHCPQIFLSDQDDFEIRVQAARVGAEGFFLKPLDIPKLIDRVDQTMKHLQAIPYRLLIVDDDEDLASHYALVLRGAGMEAKALSAPKRILEIMEEFQPELVLMDVAMPGYSGMDLARVIRMHEQWTSLPIVYLSAETDRGRQLSALSSGGDDFLTKPIADHHLVAAVSVRAARMRLLNDLMVKDSLTSLLKHSRIKELIAVEFARAKRDQTPLCVAMLDIDRFKNVNDTYGHTVGDQVIKALAHLLKQRLRKTDGIGRYGGEEFAAVLPRCEYNSALELLNDIRERFKDIRFTAGDQVFSVTLSAGVAMAAGYPDASDLLAAADEALYEAKRGGRDRVCLGRPHAKG